MRKARLLALCLNRRNCGKREPAALTPVHFFPPGLIDRLLGVNFSTKKGTEKRIILAHAPENWYNIVPIYGGCSSAG